MNAADLLHTFTVTHVEIDQRRTGENARDMRLGLKLTLRSVARIMGISASYLCDLERGRRNFGSKEGKRYLEFLAKEADRAKR